MSGQSGVHAGLYYETLFWSSGSRPPLVLLPGLLSDGRQVRRLLRELERKAVVLDPLGSGRSEAPASAAEYALPGQVPRLLAVLEHLAVREADLVGLSMGGMWAQHTLVATKDTHGQLWRSAVLVGTSARITPRMRSILLGLRAMWQHDLPRLDIWRVLQALLFSPEFLERPSAVPLLELLAGEARTPRETAICQLDALLGHDLSSALTDLGRQRIVRRVLGSELDVLMPPLTQAELSAGLGGVAVEILAGAGHAAWLEQPAAMARALAVALSD